MTASISVPLLDLKAQYATIRDEIEPVVRKVIEDQWFILGPEVSGLEDELSAYTGAAHCVGCASGSDAILVALMAMGIGCGGGRNDRVLCPAYTFFSTAGSIYRLGAIPVFADIDPATYNMDVDHARRVAEKTPGLAAIMPVHLYGQAVDMDAWLELGAEFGVPIIEDAAQAIGARDTSGAMVGTKGRVGCFSFFPSKNLGGFGDAGFISTGDEDLARAMKSLRVHGSEVKYHHDEVGLNSRIDALQAAVLRVKLRHLETWHEGRARNAAFYDRAFAEAGALDSRTPLAAEPDALPLRTPAPAEPPARHVYNQYVVRVPAAIRDGLRQHLQSVGIGTEIYYPVPLHLQKCFERLGGQPGDLPESEAAAKETIALPIYAELTEPQLRHVVSTITEFVRTHARDAAETTAGR